MDLFACATVFSFSALKAAALTVRASGGFLRDLHAASKVDTRRVVVIADNAKYHHARIHAEWRAKHAAGFGLDFLPPYSPELNSIERVWELTRRLCLHNRYFGSLDSVIEAVELQFPQWTDGNETLRRLCVII